MIMNIVLHCPVAGRTVTRLLQQPARFRMNRVRKFDGLLRRCYTSSSVDNARNSQSDMSPHEKPSTCPPVDTSYKPRCGSNVDDAKSAIGGAAGGVSVGGGADGGADGGASFGGTDSKRNLYLLLAAAGALIGGFAAYMYSEGSSSDGSKSAQLVQTGTTGTKKKPKPRVPASAADIPKHVPYLLIGGGTASFAAFRAIKSADPKAKVLVVTDETEMPYMRPPLSKEMWLSTATDETVPTSTNAAADDQFNFKQWNGKERSLFFEPADFYVDPAGLIDSPNGGVAIVRGYTVRHIDVCTRTAVLADGTEIKYDECLLATGSQPRNLDVFAAAPNAVKERVTLFRTVADFERLRESIRYSAGGGGGGGSGSSSSSKSPTTVAVIGGGFLGSELSCAIAKYGRESGVRVYQVFREAGNMGRVLPRYLSEWTANRVRDEGVTVVPDTQVEAVRMQDGRVRLQLLNGQDLLVDRVVVAVGSEPDTALAQSSGLEVDSSLGGYVVNAELEARRHLYVAGDAACFYDTKLGRRRVEHHDHAVVSGRLAGENMVGQKKPYKHQSMFWSDIGPMVGFEAIGIVDARLPTVGVFARATTSDTPVAAAANNLANDAAPVETGAGESAAVLLEAQQKVAAKSRVVEPTDDDTDVGAEVNGTGEAERYGKGVLFYLRDEKVVGVVLWNVFNRINTARAIVNEHKKWEDLNELAKLFEIHS